MCQLGEQHVGMLQLFGRRDPPACDPVLDPLHGVAEPLGYGSDTAEVFDEGCIVHGVIKRHVYANVNTVCINNSLSEGKMRPMHDSIKRLLAAARQATRDTAAPVTDFKTLGRHMEVSPQTITNWKDRGVSRDGAIKAERLYRVSVDWVLTGQNPGNTSQTDGTMAQPLSLDGHTVPPRLLLWGDMNTKNLPAEFRVALIDDAMAPDFPSGRVIEFDSRLAPRFGELVLICDKAGTPHFRLYKQAPGGSWEGSASNRAFLDLLPSRDGAKVVAVMTGYVVRTR